MSLVQNPFVAQETAKAYARGRPYFHPLVVERIRETLRLSEPLPLAVDVACGTGMSSLPLLALADRVVATDVSEEMLAQAPEHERVRYHLAPAEALPLGDEQADLITVSSAFHWLERAAFLREARRVLRSGGWLVVYENYLRGQQHPSPEVVAWVKRYYEAHPSPPRDKAPFADEDARNAGLEFAERLLYENTWTFTLPAFVAYLMSQSNAVFAVSSGLYSPEVLRLRLTEQLEPFFTPGELTFPFAGFIWLLRRT